MNDESIKDLDRLSNCCGAPIYSDIDICSDCKEHCSTIKLCLNCGEELSPTNLEKYDKDRDEYYCEQCSDNYWENVDDVEGILRKMD